jgi:REP element-mobilizing transposase RayT
MPNHVHLVMVPQDGDSLHRSLARISHQDDGPSLVL